MPDLPKPKYGPDGRPIKNSLFNIDSNINSNTNSKNNPINYSNIYGLTFFFVLIVIVFIFNPNRNESLFSNTSIIYLIIIGIILFNSRGKFKNLNTLNSDETDTKFQKNLYDNKNRNIQEFEDEESDYDEKKADELIRRFNK